VKRLALVALFHLASQLGAQTTQQQPTPSSPPADSIVAALRTGGLVIVFRHAHTDRSRMESSDFSLGDRTTQRNLSEEGVTQATHIGDRVKALGIPITEVLASPMFRTPESAQLAFGRADTTELLRSRGSSAEARALLTGVVAPGQNRVLVTHNAFLHRYFGPVGFGQIGEGDAVIVRPRGDGFDVVGRIRVADWGS
jgi:phosphohistidine phosphatase SixA